MAAIDTGDVGRIERLVDGGGDVNMMGYDEVLGVCHNIIIMCK